TASLLQSFPELSTHLRFRQLHLFQNHDPLFPSCLSHELGIVPALPLRRRRCKGRTLPFRRLVCLWLAPPQRRLLSRGKAHLLSSLDRLRPAALPFSARPRLAPRC